MPPGKNSTVSSSPDTSPAEPSRIPLVTIGMPVYNGACYLEAALRSLLSQTPDDFALLISDNGSTDETPLICRKFADEDSRIHFIRHEENRGAAWNFNFLLRQAESPFFMWAAHDDLWEPTFLLRCVEQLANTPEAVTAFTALRRIDPDGRTIDAFVMPPAGVSSHRVARRIGALFLTATYSHVYGLMRVDALRSTGGLSANWGSDVRLLLALAVLGPVAVVPEVRYSDRLLPEKTFEAMYEAVAGPGRGEMPWDATVRLFLDLVRQAWEAPLPLRERVLGVTLGLATLYDPRGPWRGGILSQLAEGMQRALRRKHVAPSVGLFLLRTVLDPRTPFQALRRIGRVVPASRRLGPRSERRE